MKLLRLLTNKFLLAATAFAVWMIFFDQNDLAAVRERREKLRETKETIARLEKEAAQMDAERQALQTDPYTLESFAREKYRMKRDGEDLYVVGE